MLALATTIGDRIHQELAVYGANIVVTPQADTLDVKVGGGESEASYRRGLSARERFREAARDFFGRTTSRGLARNVTKLEHYSSGEQQRMNPSTHVWSGSTTGRMGISGEAFPVTGVGYWFEHRFGNIVTGAPQLQSLVEARWPLAG